MTNNWIENYIQAGNPETSSEQLARLAASRNHKIRLRVAENSNTPPDILESLAGDEHHDVRLAVAVNQSTPVDITYRLAYDDDVSVRYGLAEDTNVPVGVLKILSKDDNPYVSCRAQKTLDTLQDQLPTVPQEGRILAWRRPVQKYA